MKIVFVDFFVTGHHVEYAAFLGRHLLEQGHKVTFATWQPDERLQVLSDIGLNVRYVGKRHGALASKTLHMIPQFTRGLRNCLEVAKSEDADIVHLLYLDRAMLLPLWWNVLRSDYQVPILGTLWWPYHFINSSHLSTLEKLYHRMVRKALKSLLLRRKLSFLFVHTEHIKEVVLRPLRAECLEDRFVVVPDPAGGYSGTICMPDMPNRDSSKQDCRARLGLPLDRVVLLFFGRLRGSKGPDVLLRAAKLLPRHVLVIFAGAPAGNLSLLDWEQEVRSQGLDGQVRLDLGHVPDELVSVYFEAADAVVLPYRRAVLGTSGVLQQAAVARKPVIATDVGEVGELVKRNGLGLLVEPEDPRRLADGIETYLRERKNIDASVKECASQYSALNHWRQTAASVLTAYERVLPRAYEAVQ